MDTSVIGGGLLDETILYWPRWGAALPETCPSALLRKSGGSRRQHATQHAPCAGGRCLNCHRVGHPKGGDGEWRARHDDINGGHGKDTLAGGDGRDKLRGGPEDDILDGGEDTDDIGGASGDDIIHLKAGDIPADDKEKVYGNGGQDTLELGTEIGVHDITSGAAPRPMTVTDPITGGKYDIKGIEAVTDPP